MVVVATAAPVSAAPPGGAPDQKTFTADVDGTTAGAAPETFAGDADASIELTITNTSPTQQLGSANVTVPITPFTLVSVADIPGAASAVRSGQDIELRDLALPPVTNGVATSVKVTMTVDVRTCVPTTTPAQFAIKAKQSNDFKGTGNDFALQQPSSLSDLQVSVTGHCGLAFVNQPTDADRGATITSVAFDTSAAPITVEVLDANTNNTGRATSSAASITLNAVNASVPAPIVVGNATAAAKDGLASFTPTLSVSASAYTFIASSSFTTSSTPLYSSGPSSAFAIVDEHATCLQGNACQKPVKATNPNNGQAATATFGTGGNTTNLTVSVGAADAKDLFVCDGYAPRPGTFISQFAFTDDAGSDRLGTFEITVPNASDPLNSYEVCWASTVSFTTLDGSSASVGGTKPGSGQNLFVGLLPDCPKRGEPTVDELPCVSARYFTKQGKVLTAHLEVKATGADPWAY